MDKNSVDAWALKSDAKTIRSIRKEFNMPELDEDLFFCKECKKQFLAQTENGRQRQFYCTRCHQMLKILDNYQAY